MQISVNFFAGAIICETIIDGRRYRGKYGCFDKREARKRFRARVVAAEQKLMNKKRQEIIDTCLTCTVPAEKCKGNCKFIQDIKIKRGKGIK